MRIKVEVEGDENGGKKSSRENETKKSEMCREVKNNEEVLGANELKDVREEKIQNKKQEQRKESFESEEVEENYSGEKKEEENEREIVERVIDMKQQEVDKKQEIDIMQELEKYKGEAKKYREEAEKYRREMEKYMEEAEEYRKKWLYTFSDFENYRKRVKVDIENAVKDAMVKVFSNMLSAIDSIDSAINFIKDEKVKEGVKLISKIIEDALVKSGVEVIEVREGEKFSPDKCEVVGYEELTENDVEDGTIVKVLRRGFKFSDRVIRPAQVIVAKVKETDKGEEEKKEN